MLDAEPQGAPLDRYVVLEYLAEGGMGAIYLGKKLGAGGFEKQVVLKQLLPEFTRQPEFIDLFLREARLSATLDHANIIHTIDLVTAGEEYFIVMEYLDGADLRTLLKLSKRRRKKFSPPAGIYVGRELLSALAYAHQKLGPDGTPLRLIHRDISPSNVLISGAGEVKLTDFGIAKASTHNSVLYRVAGKVGYMSPEQARSEPLDARSDLYSLAVCLFEMVTGERLFVSAGLTTSADEMYSQPVPRLSRKLPGLPTEFDDVMLKALALDPDERFQTAGEFQEALLRCAHRHGLMMSAPELAEHLRDVCGHSKTWRDSESADPPVGGTEFTEDAPIEGTEQLDVADFSDEEDEVLSIAVDGPMVPEGKRRRERAKTSLSHLIELQGRELTSLTSVINSAELSEPSGALPLVDLDDFGANHGSRPPQLDDFASAHDPASAEDAETGFVARSPAPPIRPPSTQSEISASSDVVPLPSAEPTSPPKAPESKRDSDTERAPRRRAWLVVALILLLGLGTATAIGLTGPDLGNESDTSGGGSETKASE